MDFTSLYKQLIQDFNLESLSKEDQEEMLFEVSKTIQKQFLIDVYDYLGKEKFEALEASANMGEEFYGTTLKHLVPSYEEMFQLSRQKIVKAFKQNTQN